jgi:hypothetical protein
MAVDWLISEVPSDLESAVFADLALGGATTTRRGSHTKEAGLAVSMNDIVIHNTHKRFGGADIRLDILVVHGNPSREHTGSWYMPTTRTFPNVKDGARLHAEEMLVFFGWPRYFLDLFIIASRDPKDAGDLGELLRGRLSGDDAKGAVGDILALVAAPEAVVVGAAAQAALTIGSIAFDVISSVTTKSVGVYQRSWLEHADAFGQGRHPPADGESIRADDFSFWLNVRRDEAPPKP